MTPTEDQIEAARTKVRNMLHAADHGNHLGEMAVLRMAASADLLEALERLHTAAEMTTFSDQFPGECEAARAAIAKAEGQP